MACVKTFCSHTGRLGLQMTEMCWERETIMQTSGVKFKAAPSSAPGCSLVVLTCLPHHWNCCVSCLQCWTQTTCILMA